MWGCFLVVSRESIHRCFFDQSTPHFMRFIYFSCTKDEKIRLDFFYSNNDADVDDDEMLFSSFFPFNVRSISPRSLVLLFSPDEVSVSDSSL